MFKEITGYDRVMIYRFDEEGHGEVFAETRKPELEAFLGNRYPASDIPQIARRLYVRNRVRLLADVNYAACAARAAAFAADGRDLDMSMCFLRSVSPIHIQYLKNMGVAATLVVSLMVGDKLWGLVSCHHYSPRYPAFRDARGLRTARRSDRHAHRGAGEFRARARASCRCAGSSSAWSRASRATATGAARLFDGARSLLLPLGASGAGAAVRGPDADDRRDAGHRATSARSPTGSAPQTRRRLVRDGGLGADGAAFRAADGRGERHRGRAGFGRPGEMLIWFRRERVRTITWGGNPFKSPSIGDDP